jgi:hypothetical protein
MQPRSFKEVFATVGPDRPASPALSRAQRLAKVAPPIVAEVLEGRRLLSGSASIVSGCLVVTGDGSNNSIQVYRDDGNGDLLVIIDDDDPPRRFSPSGVTCASVSGLGGDDFLWVVGGSGGSDFGRGLETPARMCALCASKRN